MRNEIKRYPGDAAEATNAWPDNERKKSASIQQLTRVLVVDDHDIVRTGLVVLLDREHDMKVVGSATTGEEAVQAARRLKPDLIIMDLALPTLNGIDATRLIRREFPQMRVIALSASQRPGHICRALSAGANGYVLKNAPGEEIVQAIKSVIAGGVFFSPAIAPVPSGGLNSAVVIQSPFERLSAREQDVLRRIAAGSTSADIAQCLSLSPKTVATYRSRLMVKLGVANRAALIRLVMEWELPAV
jgi:DNA-binding NarL/FixJ family response regulator